MRNRIQKAFLVAFAATLFLGITRIESTTYTWQYRNQGLDQNEHYQTLLDPPFGLPNHLMSGDLNHFYNWSDVGYVFGFYGHPYKGDIAIFGADGQPDVYYREGATGPKFLPDLLKFDSYAQKYNVTIMNNLSFEGTTPRWSDWVWSNNDAWGIKNESAHAQNFHLVDQAVLEFKGDSSALLADSANPVIYNVGNGDNSAGMVFRDNASAGAAPINVKNGSHLHFYDKTTAGNAAISLEEGSNLKFANNSSAAESNIALDHSTVHFSDTASAGKAQIALDDGSNANFADQASAGQSVIALKNGSSINLSGNSSLGDAAVSLEASTLTCDHDITLTSITADSRSLLKVGGTLTLGHQNDQEVLAGISDHGSKATLVKQGSGVLTLKGNSNYCGGTVLSEGTLRIAQDANLGHSSGNLTMHDGTTLEVADHGLCARSIHLKDGVQTIDTGVSAVTLSEKIEGNGKLTKKGSGTLTLASSENTYAGGTLVSEGALEGDTNTLRGDIENNAVVKFNQVGSGSFKGQFTGSGDTIKAGQGTLSMASDNSNFKGNVYVQQGKLALNNRLGGNVIVQTAGIISGTGEVLGDLHVKKGGTVSPGNSIGTLNVKGNYAQQESTYHVQLNGAGQSSLINVEGVARLAEAAVVSVSSVDGTYNTKQNYQILHADGGVQGEFAGIVVLDSPRMIPSLTYDANNVYLDFIKTLNTVATSPEQTAVAEVLEQKPVAAVVPIINSIFNLADPDAQLVLDQLSAQQYTNVLLSAELANQQFIRRLYDPLRSIVTALPSCCYNGCNCYDECDCCERSVYESWIEAGAARSFFRRNGNIQGFKTKGYEITGGHQVRLDRCWTVGSAASYAHDIVHYNIGGRGKTNTFFGALYGLYRPVNYYVLGDFACGYSNQKIKRFIDIGSLSYSTRGRPKVFTSTLYAEAGKDFCCTCHSLLVQPFVGMDLSYYRRSRIHEHGISPVNMDVAKKSYATLHSRLGVHLTTHGLRCFVISLDLAWQYRIIGQGNTIRERFNDFGSCFAVKGLQVRRNSFDGALNITIPLRSQCEVFAELSGQKWHRATVYSALAGIKITW